MKKILPTLCVFLLFIGCKKNGTNPETEGTVLLSRISYDINGSVYNAGKPAVDFIYNGKQLQKTIVYTYLTSSTATETANYAYNDQGLLSMVTYDYSPNTPSYTPIYTKVVLGYKGIILDNDVVNYITAGFIGSTNCLFSYQGNNLSQWSSGPYTDHIYTYDSNGNKIKEAIKYHQPDMDGGTINYFSFDNHHALGNSIPYFNYLITIPDYGQFLNYFSNGTNNALSSTATDISGTSTNAYSYEYNNYGYPSKITITTAVGPSSFKYEYIAVK